MQLYISILYQEIDMVHYRFLLLRFKRFWSLFFAFVDCVVTAWLRHVVFTLSICLVIESQLLFDSFLDELKLPYFCLVTFYQWIEFLILLVFNRFCCLHSQLWHSESLNKLLLQAIIIFDFFTCRWTLFCNTTLINLLWVFLIFITRGTFMLLVEFYFFLHFIC